MPPLAPTTAPQYQQQACAMRALLLASMLALPGAAYAGITLLADLRGVASSTDESWLDAGLGKQRYADEHDGLQLGQAVFEAHGQLAGTVSGKLGINAYTDRDTGIDLTEAWLLWKPLPVAGLRFRTKIGAFFPPVSLENSAPGWTSPWMVSTSAINTWVGEELRTLGAEFRLARPGLLENSPHDPEILYGVFTANDPAGALIAWRGWSVGDRVTGVTERILLPEIPFFRLPYISRVQGQWEEPFYEIDDNTGYYAGVNYTFNGWLTLTALRYDNHGDPSKVEDGQYAWDTRFDHVGLRLDLPGETTLLAQAMDGVTIMGRSGRVNSGFESWYVLLSRAFGAQRVSLRYDDFSASENDRSASDNNAEDGEALALAWQYRLNPANTVGVEALTIRSQRPERQFLHLGNNPSAGREELEENCLQLFYRWQR